MKANPGWAELWIVDGGGRPRPALVLTRPEAVERLERVLVALATSRVRGLPSEVPIGPDDGLEVECVLNLDSPELLRREYFTQYVGEFPRQRWPEVCQALAAAIGC